MNNIVLFFSIIISMCTLCALSIDILPRTLRKLERKQIGDFKSAREWYQKARYINNSWIIRLPKIKVTEQTRLTLVERLQGIYYKTSVQSWQLAALFKPYNEIEILNKNGYFDFEKDEWLVEPTEVDFGFLGYEILKRYSDCSECRNAMEQLYHLIIHNTDENGIISYRPELDSLVFVDTIGLTVPFLCAYAKIYHEKKAEKIALKNINFFLECITLHPTVLPAHAYNKYSKAPLGTIGWGRGTVWLLLGIIDSYEYLENSQKEYFKTILFDYAKVLCNYTATDGGFSAQLLFESHYDSSATSGIGYFYAKMFQFFGKESYRKVAIDCLEIIIKHTRMNGKIDISQGDTHGIGDYSNNFDILPFTQGLAVKTYEILYGGMAS